MASIVDPLDEYRCNCLALSEDEIDIAELFHVVKSAKGGAVSSFIGTTRDNFEGKEVTHLEYEAYPDMAIKSLLELCAKARAQWNLLNIVIQHKIGPCPIMDISVAILISSEHRKDSLEAVSFAINELKATVPIWKKV